ncbi:MAG: FMN-binding negative transcriptional regulator [Burkholderiaceae bacterium]|nr:FMN-binding negative transcriptional regulator [Burkholderiaceae bacterium]
MYLPKYHQFNDHPAMRSLVDAHPLGAWVCHSHGELMANHLPFVLDRSRGAHGTLIGHVSRANGVWRMLAGDAPSVVMFQGPQAYITPGWYPGKGEHGEVAPTWNYVVVHAHGVARAVEDEAWMLDMLERLVQAQESGRAKPWRVDDAPVGYIDRMLRAIVGIEIPIDRLEGKRKLSQDEALADRIGTVHGLMQEDREESRLLGALVNQQILSSTP